MDKEKKLGIIQKYARNEGDTGSVEVQVAMLTDRINQLTGHLVQHKHDYHTRRGLLRLVGQRKRLLSYLSRENVGRYNQLIAGLGLRK
ncbi:MAG: 30S ribosomal protein S15 [Dehalococcoidia bacterium]|nr:MAG: 30S ribosomal protein S15 [Dehalococcoidia bacterium]